MDTETLCQIANGSAIAAPSRHTTAPLSSSTTTGDLEAAAASGGLAVAPTLQASSSTNTAAAAASGGLGSSSSSSSSSSGGGSGSSVRVESEATLTFIQAVLQQIWMQVRLHGAGVTHDTGAPAIIMQVRLHS